MSLNPSTVKCKICGEPYKFYPYSAADQSACPGCVRKAEAKEAKRLGITLPSLVEPVKTDL